MSEHRYILEPYKGIKTRYTCPSCQHKGKIFTRYIDTETSEHIALTVGRCNRESNCGYHYTPKQYFQDNNISPDTNHTPARKFQPVAPAQKPAPQTTSYISIEAFKASLKEYEKNHFVRYLLQHFGEQIASQLVSRYFIASSKYWNGATVFWQIDIKGKVRTGKIMLYNPATGKRIKEPFNHIHWVHKVLKQPEYELRQCLFGEHLLNDINKVKPVAIVESEKTAIIASAYLPQFIWLAVGSLTNLNANNCKVLKGRTVTLFPDLNGFEKWSSKAEELSAIASFKVSDLLERNASEAERKQGLDLADYLIRFPLSEFVSTEPLTSEPPQPIGQTVASQPIVRAKPVEHSQPLGTLTAIKQPESWEPEISNLEYYFSKLTLPSQPVRLNTFSTVTDIQLFIESHFATVKANNGKITFLPYLERLQALKQVLTH